MNKCKWELSVPYLNAYEKLLSGVKLLMKTSVVELSGRKVSRGVCRSLSHIYGDAFCEYG